MRLEEMTSCRLPLQLQRVESDTDSFSLTDVMSCLYFDLEV